MVEGSVAAVFRTSESEGYHNGHIGADDHRVMPLLLDGRDRSNDNRSKVPYFKQQPNRDHLTVGPAFDIRGPWKVLALSMMCTT